MNKKGFTLVELVIAITIMTLIVGMVTRFFIVNQDGHVSEKNAMHTKQNSRIIFDIIIEDLRIAAMNPRGSNAFQIRVADTSNIVFTADIDPQNINPPFGNGAYDPAREYFRYYKSGNSLRGVRFDSIGGDREFYDKVQRFRLTYYDENGTLLATPVDSTNRARIARIDVTLTLTSDRKYGKGSASVYQYGPWDASVSLRVRR
ncbi:MAG: prepilin-type N-terminal cleavage/methylation domain-containing protein [Candidatus Coatesbacteria bacterium]|nr:prepilin-type N-terminal cleavage/methylation domain-containing protein [Candidatus Coatesbacteria bacterium]